MDWVTDPKAIDVLVELNELREGDEVRIIGAENYGLPVDWNGCTRPVVAGDLEGLDETVRGMEHVIWREEPPVACVKHSGWIICRKNIAAWRRPSAHKE